VPEIVDLPAPEMLARLVNTANEMLYGASVTFGGGCSFGLPDLGEGHTAFVPLIGSPTYVVAATAVGEGGYELAGMMFDCSPSTVDDQMVQDSLSELVNILAGQLKAFIAPTHSLGLPSKLIDSATLADYDQSRGARVYIGNSQTAVDVRVIAFAALNLDEACITKRATDTVLRALVADDDDLVRGMLVAILDAAGISVVADAADGTEASRLFKLEKPDVVCLDVNMPGQTGIEVLQSIKKEKPDAVVILISAFNTTENVLEGLRNQADGVISKPFKRENVINEILRAYAKLKRLQAK